MIYIIITVFNRKSFTKACLISLYQQTVQEFRIVVVDHGSADGTSEMIQSEFPEVILLKGDESMWWAAATNLGIREALNLSSCDGDFILTLNNDLEVSPSYLEELLKVYTENRPCLVGSTSVDILNPDKINFVGTQWDNIFAKYSKPEYCNYSSFELIKVTDKVATDLLPGRGTLIPMEVFKTIGLLDEENFPHYAADEDFSLRAKNKGYALWVSTKAVVRSHVNATGINVKKKLSISQFLSSLNAIRSANNLKHRYKWAKIHAKNPNVYFAFDMMRLLGSYCRSLLK